MAQEIGALYYDLNINDNNLAAQLNSTDNKVKSFGQRISGYWENSVAASGRFMLAMGVAGGAVAALGVVGVKSAADFEQSRVAFETMLGSADKARRMMQDIAKFAKETPFELPEVVAASKQLLAFGFAQEQILPTMRKLGDLAAGLGVPVGQLTNVFGQVRVAGRLMGQDLLQFTNAGVPLIEALANTMHKPQTEIKQLVEQGKVGFPEVETAINSLTGASSKFGGMMEKQSHTFNGVISNIKDGFGQALRSMIGITAAGDVIQGGLFDKLKRGAEIVMPIVQRLPELMHEGFEKIRPLIPVIAGAIVSMLIPAVVALTINFAGFLATLAPWAALGAAIGFAVSYLVQSFGGWERVTINVKNAMLDLWAAIKPIRDSLGSLWNTIETNLTPALQGLWRSLKDLYAAMQPEVISALETIGKIMGGYLLFNMKVQIEIMKIMIDVWSVLIRIYSEVIQWYIKLIDKVKEFAKATKDATIDVKNAFVDLWHTIDNVYNSIKDALSQSVSNVRQWSNDVKNILKGVVDGTKSAGLEIFHAFDGGAGTTNFVNDINDINDKLASFTNDTLKGWGDGFNRTKDKIKNSVDGIGNFFEALPGRIVKALKQATTAVGNWFTDLYNSVSNGIQHIGDSIGNFFNDLPGKIGAGLNRIVDAIGNFFSDIPNKVSKSVGDAGNKAGDSFTTGAAAKMTSMDTIRKVGDAIITMIALALVAVGVYLVDAYARLVQMIASGIGTGIAAMVGVGASLVTSLASGMISAVGSVLSVIGNIISSIIGAFGAAGSWLVGAGSSIVGGLVNGIQSVVGVIWSALQSIISGIVGMFLSAGGWLFGAGSSVVHGLANGVRSVYGDVYSAVIGIINGIIGAFGGAAGWLYGAGLNIVRGLANGMRAVSGEVYNAIKAAADQIGKFFGGAANWLYDTGKAIVQGLINGIKNMASAVGDAAGGIASGVKDKFKSVLGIHSPSTVFAGFGQQMMIGMANGIKGSTRNVVNAADDMFDKLLDSAKSIQGALTPALLMPNSAINAAVNSNAMSGYGAMNMPSNVSNNTNSVDNSKSGDVYVQIGTINDKSDADYILGQMDRNTQLQGMGVSPVGSDL